MSLPSIEEKWAHRINAVTIGACKAEGGTRARTVTVGAEEALPFLHAEGTIPHPPVIALEVWDCPPEEWPAELQKAYGAKLQDPVAWARFSVKELGAQLLAVRLMSTHPEYAGRSPEQAARFLKELAGAVDVPLIVLGPQDAQSDNAVLPVCSEALKGERCLIGSAVQDNYKTLAAAAMADGHTLIAESPIDVNIAKQLNILISDMGLPLERIVMDPTIGSLGYGLEYAYSIMERARLAAFSGDKTIASPFICFVGQETWKTKEAGFSAEHGVLWEAVTAVALLQAGADILVMRHPLAAEKVRAYVEEMMESKK